MSRERLDKAYDLIINKAYDEAREILLDLQERSSTARRWLANLERMQEGDEEASDEAANESVGVPETTSTPYDMGEEDAYADDDAAYIGEPEFGTEEALEFEPEFEHDDLDEDTDLFADLQDDEDDEDLFSEFAAEVTDDETDFDEESVEEDMGPISEFGDFLDAEETEPSESTDTMTVPTLDTEPEFEDELVVDPEVAEIVESEPRFLSDIYATADNVDEPTPDVDVSSTGQAASPSSASGEYETLTNAYTHDGRQRWEYREIVLKDWRQHMSNIEYALEQGGEKITIEDAYTKLLNENGAQGWEVVSEEVLPQQYVRLLMKRPVA